MGKVIVSMFVSLDGVIQDPQNWSFPYWGEDIAEFKFNELFAADTLLLGRVTYEAFAEAWSVRTDAGEFADRINAMPKLVVSTTLQKATWGKTTIIRDDLTTRINQAKQQFDGDILLYGGAKLLQSLVNLNLVDQYNLLMYPIVLGEGLRLFSEGTSTKLKLVESKACGLGVVSLIYHPADTTDAS